MSHLHLLLTEMPAFAAQSTTLIRTIATLPHCNRGIPKADALRMAADLAEKWAAAARELAEKHGQ